MCQSVNSSTLLWDSSHSSKTRLCNGLTLSLLDALPTGIPLFWHNRVWQRPGMRVYSERSSTSDQVKGHGLESYNVHLAWPSVLTHTIVLVTNTLGLLFFPQPFTLKSKWMESDDVDGCFCTVKNNKMCNVTDRPMINLGYKNKLPTLWVCSLNIRVFFFFYSHCLLWEYQFKDHLGIPVDLSNWSSNIFVFFFHLKKQKTLCNYFWLFHGFSARLLDVLFSPLSLWNKNQESWQISSGCFETSPLVAQVLNLHLEKWVCKIYPHVFLNFNFIPSSNP